MLVKLSPGASGVVRSAGATYRAVVIQGTTSHRLASQDEPRALPPGSYFSADGGAAEISCVDPGPCLVYVRKAGAVDIRAASPR